VDERDGAAVPKLARRLREWNAVGGGYRADGSRVTKPAELEDAEMLYLLCQAYGALPDAGGVLDQNVALLRAHSVLNAGGFFGSATISPDPIAEIPMVSL
jgi:hypothetical protein